MWVAADEQFDFLIEFLSDGDFVVPTAATATVRDTGGTPIGGLENVPLDVSSTSCVLNIPAAALQVATGVDFETRFVSVRFTAGGEIHDRLEYFKVAPFLPITASPQDVRAELGLDRSEAPDADIDVREAYVLLKLDYGSVVETALAAGGTDALLANQAVVVKAALKLVDSLPFRVAIKMKAEDSAAERMAKFDVREIRLHLGQKLSGLIDQLGGVSSSGTPTLVVSSPTDAITGE